MCVPVKFVNYHIDFILELIMYVTDVTNYLYLSKLIVGMEYLVWNTLKNNIA